MAAMAHGQVQQESPAIGRPSSAAWGERLRPLARRYAYGSILISTLMVLWWAVEGPYPIEYVSNGLYVLMLFIIVGLEIWIPFTRSWGDIRKATRADVVYFLLAAPIDSLHIFLLVGLLAATARSSLGIDECPSLQPKRQSSSDLLGEEART